MHILKEMIALLNLSLDELVFLLVVGFVLVFFVFEGLDLDLEGLVHGFEGLGLALEQGIRL